MSAGDVAAIVGAVAAAVLVVGLLVTLRNLARTLAQLRQAVEDLHGQTVPLMEDLHLAVKQANSDLGRVEGLIDRAETLGATVDAASRLAYLTFSNPVVKGLAVGTGVARAARRFRKA